MINSVEKLFHVKCTKECKNVTLVGDVRDLFNSCNHLDLCDGYDFKDIVKDRSCFKS